VQSSKNSSAVTAAIFGGEVCLQLLAELCMQTIISREPLTTAALVNS